MKVIYFAGGCFWGVEEYFSRIEGVTSTCVGYANSIVENPGYREVSQGFTDAAECVKVQYNEDIVSLETLLEKFFKVIDPTLLNRQGADIGTQYRTGIYFADDEFEKPIKDFVAKIQNNYEKPIVTEVHKLRNFYVAEDYHQKYLRKNPDGYCHIKL